MIGLLLALLGGDALREAVERFNARDRELVRTAIPNAEAAAFLAANVPAFDAPDRELVETYRFRWWTYRKHLKSTPDGWVVTEFLPQVPWSGKHNTISCPAGHHFYEGRWLRDPKYLDDYARFWFRKGGAPRLYSFWAADALWARRLASGDPALTKDLLPELAANWRGWEKTNAHPSGLFKQSDDRDGMEVSIGGSGVRATINSYQYGDARAVARIARESGDAALAAEFDAKADTLRRLVLEKLWDVEAGFFKVLKKDGTLADVRELHGYTPWYVGLPGPEQDVAWKQLMDPEGFFAPFGPTSAERRHPKFAIAYAGHECQWNGPSWPMATSVVLTALANRLQGESTPHIGKPDYLKLLQIYAASHRRTLEDGTIVPWIDENLNPLTGDWISRTLLTARSKGKGVEERGKDYNHSSFCDLVITGLVGLRPRADEILEVNPLLPEGTWPWFELDRVPYHGRLLTIRWDLDGTRYRRGQGLRLYADGKELAASDTLRRLTAPLK